MNSANVDMMASAEKDSLNPSYLPISRSANSSSSPLPVRDNRPRRAMMSRIKHALFVVFAIVLLASALVGASKSGQSRDLSPEAQQFRELLDALDAATLHEILHEHFKDKYKHGVYQQDKSALEALHRQNAEVATSLVRLARRQSPDNSNGSSVVTTTAVTETTVEVTVTSSGAPPSSPPEQTPTPTPTPSPTPSGPAQPDSTPITSTSPPNPPASTTAPGSPPSSTPVEVPTSSVPTVSVPTTLTSASTPANPTTSAASRTATTGTTRRPAATEDVTTSIVYTTTLANGAAVVTTQYTVVPADQVAQPTGSGGTGTNTAKASLQTGLANSQYQRGGLTVGLGFLGMVVACGL